MKKLVFIFMAIMSMTFGYAQEEPESSTPSRNMEIIRRCEVLDIEGKIYHDCVVTLKSTGSDYFLSDDSKVKVLVNDESGKKIYKKTYKSSFLYIYSNGQVQVGRPKFNQIVIQRFSSDKWYCEIKEKEGIW